MAKRNRSTLKNYFRDGAMPSSKHFSDLIDSCVNQLDEGFDKPPGKGLKITALDQQHLLSFYQQADPNTPLWHIGFTEKQADLEITTNPKARLLQENNPRPEQNEAANLTLKTNGNIGINKHSPQHALDIQGTMASTGRRGAQMLKAGIPADGNWHDLTPELQGCHMLEVVAGIGIKDTGRYAMLHAIATNTCAPNNWWWQWRKKNPIKAHHAYFRSSADKLQLRWKHSNKKGSLRPYVLQIRTNTSYGENRFIRYHLTQLWQDQYMEDCASPKKDE